MKIHNSIFLTNKKKMKYQKNNFKTMHFPEMKVKLVRIKKNAETLFLILEIKREKCPKVHLLSFCEMRQITY